MCSIAESSQNSLLIAVNDPKEKKSSHGQSRVSLGLQGNPALAISRSLILVMVSPLCTE